LCMFIRKKKNRSGTTSVVVVDKSRGSFRELVTIGVSNDSSEIESLCRQGKRWNTSLPVKEVYEQYNGLWIIERAYRVTKGTLEMRPMFHFTPRRIEAHVCICFVAYKVYKELERILKITGVNLSVDKVLNIAKTITTIKVKLPTSGATLTKTMLLKPKHKSIAMLFDEKFWENFSG
jgi:transposase